MLHRYLVISRANREFAQQLENHGFMPELLILSGYGQSMLQLVSGFGHFALAYQRLGLALNAMKGNPASGFALLVFIARSKNARASPYRLASLKPLPSISRYRTCPPTSPLAIADKSASPTIVAARRLSPSRKPMIPSSPFARDSHWASPNWRAIVWASVQVRFAEAGLISKSVYPFAARHHSRSFGSLLATGISSCCTSMSDTSTHDILSDWARILPTRAYVSFLVSPFSLKSSSART